VQFTYFPNAFDVIIPKSLIWNFYIAVMRLQECGR